MAKEANYFSHDYYTRGGEEIQVLIEAHGPAIYGIFWAIIEILHEEESHEKELTSIFYRALAKQMSTNAEQIESFVKELVDVGLLKFEKDSNSIWSDRVNRNIEKRSHISEIRSKSGKAGAEKKANNKQTTTSDKQNLANAKQKSASGQQKEAKESKVKDIKEKETKEKETKKEVSSQSSLFTSCIDVYNKFCLKITSVKADIDSLQGKSMNGIIEYLQKNVHDKDGGDDAILSAWVFILDEYKNWEKFHKENIKLNQIRTNLVNIIAAIKRNHKPTEQENIKNRRAELLKDEPDGKPEATTT